MRSVHVVVALVAAARAAAAATATVSVHGRAAYDAFRLKYRRGNGTVDTVSYETRRALFERSRAQAEAHNANPDARWVAVVNQFSDYTDAEHRAMLGYRRSASWQRAWAPTGTSSFLEMRPSTHLADRVDWRPKVRGTSIREQGACGSCWAVASVSALEMHAEIHSKSTRRLSYEQVVDCAPNPHHCGGEGGCKGSTAELAFQYVQENGIVEEDAYPRGYQHEGDGKCKHFQKRALSVQGFVRLETNNLQRLLEAVNAHGPIVVSVDAARMSSYGGGIYDKCPRDSVVNHAIILMGYGAEEPAKKSWSNGFGIRRRAGTKYWLLRNSWGDAWGESGYMRMLRHDSDTGAKGYCGTDRNPQEGVGCDGGPKEVPVCGMCGVLSDSVYPTNVQSSPKAVEEGLTNVQSSPEAVEEGLTNVQSSPEAVEEGLTNVQSSPEAVEEGLW